MGEGRLRSEPLALGVSCLALVGPFPWCVLFLGALFFVGAIYELLGQAWGMAKESLQRAALGRMAAEDPTGGSTPP